MIVEQGGGCGSFLDGLWEIEFWRVDEEGKVTLLLGKGEEGICNRVMEDVGECVLYWLG